jgi:ribosomal protein S27AE
MTTGSTKNNNRKCPKCSSDMVKHPSMLSMPLTSPELQSNKNTTKENMNIEDQEANFIFRFHSCSKCGYTELYLNKKGKRV